MSLFVANRLIGWIGGFYERMTPVEFWSLYAAIGKWRSATSSAADLRTSSFKPPA